MLLQTIENLYIVFSKYSAPKKIRTNGCISCVTPEAEEFFLKKTLKELNDSLFGMYFYACNVDHFPNQQDKYFIPRILELYAEQIPNVDWAFIEYVMYAFSNYKYQEFPQKEKQAIDDFFEAYLQREFFEEDSYQDSHQIIEIAIMGFDLNNFLEKLKTHETLFLQTRQEIFEYIENKKKSPKGLHYENFEQWSQFGTLPELISFLR